MRRAAGDSRNLFQHIVMLGIWVLLAIVCVYSFVWPKRRGMHEWYSICRMVAHLGAAMPAVIYGSVRAPWESINYASFASVFRVFSRLNIHIKLEQEGHTPEGAPRMGPLSRTIEILSRLGGRVVAAVAPTALCLSIFDKYIYSIYRAERAAVLKAMHIWWLVY